MADKIPIRGSFNGGSLTGLAQYATGDTLGVAHGGMGLAAVGANQLLTGHNSSTTGALTSESNLTFDGTILKSTGDLCATVKVVSPALCIGSEYVLPTADGSAGQIMCTNGSGALAFATASSGVTLAGSTNNTIATVTGSDALCGEGNLTFDGSTLGVAGAVTITKNNDYGVSTYDGTNAGGTIGFGTLSADANGGWLFKNVYYNGSAWAVNNSSVGAGAMKFDSSGNIIWLTQASGSGLPAEVMRIDSSGKVGIATTSPCHTLNTVRNTTTNDEFAGSFKDTTASYQLQTHGTSSLVTGTAIESYHDTSSPADGDFAGQYHTMYKDSGGNKILLGLLGWFADDVTAGSIDSKMEFRTYQNSAGKLAYLTSAGVWTDASAAADKEYLGTRQEVWPDGILAKIKTLNVSKYQPANQPEDKPVTETHVSPTAEDFWDALRVGTDPRAEKLNREGENTNSPTIAAKDLGGVALVAVQELLDRVEAAEAKIAVLESA